MTDDSRRGPEGGAGASAGEGSVGKEGQASQTPTPLPWNFRCLEGHWHTIMHISELLREDTPHCLLRRIALEWAELERS